MELSRLLGFKLMEPSPDQGDAIGILASAITPKVGGGGLIGLPSINFGPGSNNINIPPITICTNGSCPGLIITTPDVPANSPPASVEPAKVPAPVPAIGAMACFGWSRRLRQRIRARKQLPVVSAIDREV